MLLDTSFVRFPAAVRVRGRSRSQTYVEINEGLMPPPVRIRGRATAWPAYELDALNRAEIAGASDDEIRALVRQLLQQRKSMMLPVGQTEAA